MKTIGIIGYGSFTKFIIDFVNRSKLNFKIKISSRSNAVDNMVFFELHEVCKCDILIPSVPINKFEEVIKRIKPLVSDNNTLLLDICSIKTYPKSILEKYWKDQKYILTHPMFGPESYKRSGYNVRGFKLVFCESNNISKNDLDAILNFTKNLGFENILMTSDEHDKLAAVFHFTTMFVALMIKRSGLKRSQIDTVSASKMFDFIEMIGEDLGILQDMYAYNPYCKKQMNIIDSAYVDLKDEVYRFKQTKIQTDKIHG